MNNCFAIKAESYFRLFEFIITTQLFSPFPHSWRMNYCGATDKTLGSLEKIQV